MGTQAPVAVIPLAFKITTSDGGRRMIHVNAMWWIHRSNQDVKESPADQVDIIGYEDARTLPGLLFERARRDPSRVGFSEARRARWTDVTWQEMVQTVGRFRAALDAAGMNSGDRVAIMLPNCTDWVAFDMAAMSNGLITVPLYMHDSGENTCAVLEETGARLCFVSSNEKWSSVSTLADVPGTLEQVWIRDGAENSTRDGAPKVTDLSEVLSEDRVSSSDIVCGPDDIATIIYTSGTTGRPKGVMLTHRALLWNAEAVTKFVPPLTSDVFLSVLPLVHAFERTMGYHLPIMGGSRIVYARSIDTLRADMSLIRPTVLTAVPRLYERIYEAILENVSAHSVKRKLTLKAADIGWQLSESRHGRAPMLGTLTRHVLWPALRYFVARPVLQAFGGRIRVAVSGGAALTDRVRRFLIGLGLPLLEGYGLTETAPVVTADSFEDYVPGSVGRALRGVDLRLSGAGELLIRSPAMMEGYWKQPDLTAEVLDAEGWLKTGDLAEIRNGRVFIKGRQRDTIVLSTAKKVAPTEVEAAIQRDPLFDQVCVLGNAKPCLVALTVLDSKTWESVAEEAGVDHKTPNASEAQALILRRMEAVTAGLAPYSRVRGVHVLTKPWNVTDGTLTPTLKIRRHVVEERNAAEIDALYKSIAEQRTRLSQASEVSEHEISQGAPLEKGRFGA